MALPAAGLYSRYRHLIPELLKFGVVGGIGAVIDLGGAAVLHGEFHVEALEAKAISTIIADRSSPTSAPVFLDVQAP